MLKKIALVVAVLLVALLAYAATKPSELRVERSASINAPPEKIHALISDFNTWPSWSPWEKLDPAMKKSLSGAPSGQGAIYEWEGNSDVGKGRMEILDSPAPSQVNIKLDFLEPFEAHNTTTFTLEPQGAATNVRWVMLGHNNYMSKLMSVFMDFDAMIGKDFETGLTNLKAVAER